MTDSTLHSKQPRSISFALALTAGFWALGAHTAAARSADGISALFHAPLVEPVLRGAFLVFLIATGFAAIHWIATRATDVRIVNRLPRRDTAGLERRLGAATGWTLALCVVIPVVLVRGLTPSLWWSGRAVAASLIALAALALLTLACELVFRGYIFTQLADALSPGVAAFVVSCLYVLAAVWALPGLSRLAQLSAFAFSLLLCFAARRTRALWMPWGVHFAYAATLSVLFGTPVAEASLFTGIVDSSVQGRPWLTGGTQTGPQGSFFALIFTLAAMFAVYHLTRDLAWHYAAPMIVGAGQPMDIAPPKAHTDMEAAAHKAPLVQILAATPSEVSTSKAVREHFDTDRIQP